MDCLRLGSGAGAVTWMSGEVIEYLRLVQDRGESIHVSRRRMQGLIMVIPPSFVDIVAIATHELRGIREMIPSEWMRHLVWPMRTAGYGPEIEREFLT